LRVKNELITQKLIKTHQQYGYNIENRRRHVKVSKTCREVHSTGNVNNKITMAVE